MWAKEGIFANSPISIDIHWYPYSYHTSISTSEPILILLPEKFYIFLALPQFYRKHCKDETSKDSRKRIFNCRWEKTWNHSVVPLRPYPSIQERSPCTDHKPSLARGCAKADSFAPSGAAALSKHKWRDAPPPHQVAMIGTVTPPACSWGLNGTEQRWTCLRRHTATSSLLASAAFQLASAALLGPVNFCTCCSWIPHRWSAMMIMVMMMTKHEWELDRALDLHTKNTHMHWCGSLATSGWARGWFFQSLCSSALQIPSTFQLLGRRIWGFQKRASLQSSTRCGAWSFSGSIAVWRMVQSSWRRQWQWWWFWSMERCRLSSQPRAAVDTADRPIDKLQFHILSRATIPSPLLDVVKSSPTNQLLCTCRVLFSHLH